MFATLKSQFAFEKKILLKKLYVYSLSFFLSVVLPFFVLAGGETTPKVFYFPCSMEEYMRLKPKLATLGDDVYINFVQESGVVSWVLFKINPERLSIIPAPNEYLLNRIRRVFPDREINELELNTLPEGNLKEQIQLWLLPPSEAQRTSPFQEPLILIQFNSLEQKREMKPKLMEWLKDNESYKVTPYKENGYLLIFPPTENPLNYSPALSIKNQLQSTFPDIQVELHTYSTLR